MKKSLILFCLLFCLTLLFTGCTIPGVSKSSDKKTEKEKKSDEEEAAKSKKKKKKKKTEEKSEDAASDPDETEDEGMSDDAEFTEHEDGELTGKELSDLDDTFCDMRYYGFLLTEYDDPRDVDWNEVCYNGAGLDTDIDYESAVESYLKKTHEEEMFGDLTVIPEEALFNFVKETTGYDYSEMHYPLDWIFLKDLDAYVSEHGDTNYYMYSCESGEVEDNVYTVSYLRCDWEGITFGDPWIVKFKLKGDTPVFLSNECTGDPYAVTSTGATEHTWADDFIFPYSNTEKLTEDDLAGLSKEELRLGRNEIYARYGRKFSDKNLQSYFNEKSWYFPTVEASDWSDKVLNEVETYNVKFIKKHE